MIEVTFYVATFAEAINRANRVSPKKGPAWDKAHGIIIEHDPAVGDVVIRSTDLQVYYREIINDVIKVESTEPFIWRLDAGLFDGVIRNLPIEGELTMKQGEGDTHVNLKCGRKKANLILMPDTDSFPSLEFPEVDERFINANGLGNSLKQVGWACDATSPLLQGVHFDGETIVATDKYKSVKVPFQLDCSQPFTVPLAMLSGVLSNLPGEFRLYAADDKMHLAIGEEIQITTTVLDGEFPPVRKLKEEDFKYSVEVPRQELSDMISNQLVLVQRERFPRVQFDLENNELMVAMFIPSVGDMEDFISVPWPHEPLHIEFTPDYVIKALSGSNAKTVELNFDSSKAAMVIKDNEGFVGWVAPRQEGS